MAYSVPALATFNLQMKRTTQPLLKPRFALILCACWLLLLSACGQTGPLYLPDKTVQAEPVDVQPVSEEEAEDTIEVDEDAG